jgi:hypothetical protein
MEENGALMTNKHLIIQCWNCGQWNFYGNGHDHECDCGVMVFEESDALSSGEKCEVRVLNLDQVWITGCAKLAN